MRKVLKSCFFLLFCSQTFGLTNIIVDSNQDNPSGPIMNTTLRDAINQINQALDTAYEVEFQLIAPFNEISLLAGLPPLNISSTGTHSSTVTFNTTSVPVSVIGISSGTATNIFFIVDGTVTIQNMTLTNGTSQGGNGVEGGGGGLGAGGAVFVNNLATCTLID